MRYTYLDLIEEVLRSEKREMTLGEIWEVAEEKGYSKKLMSIGKTPVNTMNAFFCILFHLPLPTSFTLSPIHSKNFSSRFIPPITNCFINSYAFSSLSFRLRFSSQSI